jgi:nucleotide-binding universal stress UspA family protein
LPAKELTMTYRSMFVHVDDSAACAQRLAVAARLARAYNAELTGAYLVPTGSVTPFTSAVLPSDVVEERLRAAGDAQSAAEARFRAAATDAGVSSSVWHAPAGDPVDAAVLHARYADLAIIGQPLRDEPTKGFSATVANAVLMSSGRPVLFVPFAGKFSQVGRRIMIAWKDSRESARAVADALPLLKDAEHVVAVAIAPDGTEGLTELLADKHVDGFLRRHQVRAVIRRLRLPDIGSGEMLLSQAADLGVDLIVMGGYSRQPMVELLWGGVTRTMLSSMTVPVLMSH